jgi:hypothetical protein
MSKQVAIGRQFFPQRVVGDTVHSGMALGMPEPAGDHRTLQSY